MKVLMVNGSPHAQGCTYTALCEVGTALEEEGVAFEIVQLGARPMQDCIACGRCRESGQCTFDGGVNDFLSKAAESDGFVFGSPVYYAHPSGRLLSFLDRAFFAASNGGSYPPFAGKPGAAVVSARRAGTSASLDAITKYFGIASMPTAGSTYWNNVHGMTPEDVRADAEGLQTMRNLGKNLAWMLRAFERAKECGSCLPAPETRNQTNFIDRSFNGRS